MLKALVKISMVTVECLLEGAMCAIIIASGKKPKKVVFKK